MIMKNSIKTLIVYCLALTALSCAKDKGNYEYNDINRVSVEVSESAFRIQQLQELEINPILTETIPQANDGYTYAWTIYPTTSTVISTDVGVKEPEAILLSSEKNLKATISLPPRDYYLQYTVTNNTTGVKTMTRYLLTVTGAFYEGWLVMANVNGNAKLSFIRKDDAVFMDPIKQINGFDLKGKGLKAYSGVISRMSEIFVFTDQEGYRFKADDFTLSADDSQLFTEKINFSNPYYTVNSINTDQYIVNDGKVYATIAPNFGAPGKYSIPFSGPDHVLFSYFFAGDSRYYGSFYDNSNKRFLHTSYNSRVLNTFGGIAGANYDLRDVGKTMVAADRGMNKEYYTIMKDDNGYYYYAYNPNLASPAGLHQAIQNSPDIAQATAFSASSALQHLYYAAGNKIYLYDILANSSRLFYEFPVGKKIKDMQMYKDKGWGKFKDPLFNKRLVVATYDGTEGEVFYFNLSPTGDLDGNNYGTSFRGFGEIVQLNYRNPNE